MAALVGLNEPGQDGAFLATGKRGPTGKLISVKDDLSYSYQIRRPRLNIDGNSGERMISMSFEYEVKEFAKSLGADLIGITSSESKYLKDNKASIEAILPSCKSLVVLAKLLNDDAISSRNIKIAVRV